MKTINLHVGDLLSPLGALGVEKQLAKLAGVNAASVNQVSGCATVTFDEGTITQTAIQEAIEHCDHHCGGELAPAHACERAASGPNAATLTTYAGNAHRKHGHPGMRHGAEPATRPPTAAHAEHNMPMDDMSHEMGHGSGMDMQEMVRDMRNRFLVSRAFSRSALSLSAVRLKQGERSL